MHSAVAYAQWLIRAHRTRGIYIEQFRQLMLATAELWEIHEDLLAARSLFEPDDSDIRAAIRDLIAFLDKCTGEYETTVRVNQGTDLDGPLPESASDDASWLAEFLRRPVEEERHGLKDPTVRAFSKVREDQAVIVVSTKDEPYPRIFSAIHEYCHVTLHSTGVCDLLDHSKIERYCNEVAAGVLLPSALLDRALAQGMFSGSDDAADVALKTLAGQLHVSQHALLIALRDRHAGRSGTSSMPPSRTGVSWPPDGSRRSCRSGNALVA